MTVTKTKAEEELKWQNVEFIREKTEKITIPEGMPWDRLAKWVELRRTEDERFVAINEVIETFPLDGAHALVRAMERKFGWVDAVPTPGFWRDEPPEMIGVEIAAGKTIQIPWSRFQIPDVEGYIEPKVMRKDDRMVFQLTGEVKHKHMNVIAELAALARTIARKESIYKGKAIRVAFPPLKTPQSRSEEAAMFDPLNHAPKFLDLSQVNEEELIFPEDVESIVRTALYNPVEYTQDCRDHRIPLKRGVLLEGPYGTGKTLTANVMALKCIANGWTFIYLASVKQLKQAIEFAAAYGPAMIFAEDVDSVIASEERNDAMNDILNTIDGVEGKHAEVITVLTTNHVERIHPAMLRPGRLDAVISIRRPDAGAVQRLIRLYGRGLVGKKEDLSHVGDKLGDKVTPAVIREVVERAKLAAISHLRGKDGTKKEMYLSAADLDVATETMLRHLALLEPKIVEQAHPFQVLGKAVGDEIGKAMVSTTNAANQPAKANGRPAAASA